MTELVPAPAALASLLTRMVQPPWPTTEQDRRVYLDQLGLQETSGPSRPTTGNHPDLVDHAFTVPFLTGVDGTGSVYRGEVLGFALFAYNRPVDDDPRAREAYAQLRDHLSASLGAPVEEWGSSAAPACLWRAGPLHLDLYCFQRGSSGIMVGPSHSERSAAFDAAADARSPVTPC